RVGHFDQHALGQTAVGFDAAGVELHAADDAAIRQLDDGRLELLAVEAGPAGPEIFVEEEPRFAVGVSRRRTDDDDGARREPGEILAGWSRRGTALNGEERTDQGDEKQHDGQSHYSTRMPRRIRVVVFDRMQQ